MEYPSILESKIHEGQVVIAYSKNTVTHIDGDFKGVYRSNYKTSNCTNITREYLEGKCVKIESPEHSEFLQKLAFNAGFKWKSTGKHEYLPVKDGYIHFRSEGMLRNYTTSFSELITISLPPKAKPEPKEWPQVGDTVTWGKAVDNAKLLAVHESSAWVIMLTSGDYNDYRVLPVSELKKPKNEADILRDDLITLHCALPSERDDAIDLFTSKYNITKKPQ